MRIFRIYNLDIKSSTGENESYSNDLEGIKTKIISLSNDIRNS